MSGKLDKHMNQYVQKNCSILYTFKNLCQKSFILLPLRQGNVFTPVCHSVHRGGGVCPSACWDTHTPWADTPRQTPPGQTPLSGQTPLLGRHPPGRHLPCPVHAGIHIPLPSACSDTHAYCCRWYASYWNAFLLDDLDNNKI